MLKDGEINITPPLGLPCSVCLYEKAIGHSLETRKSRSIRNAMVLRHFLSLGAYHYPSRRASGEMIRFLRVISPLLDNLLEVNGFYFYGMFLQGVRSDTD